MPTRGCIYLKRCSTTPFVARHGATIYRLYRHHRTTGSTTDTLEAVRVLSADEVERYLAALKHLHDFAQMFDLPVLVNANLDAVRSEIARFEADHKREPRGALNQDPTNRRVLQRVVINYLNAVRLYLDHRETHLSRRYGTESAPLRAFNAARRAQHAAVAEYSFVYELRNYVQHCGMPLQALRAEQRLVVVDGVERLDADTVIGCRKDDLLTEFDDWRYSRGFIESQPTEFPLLPILERMCDCLVVVETAAMNAIMLLLWPEAQFVCRLLAEATDDSRVGMVADIDLPPSATGHGSMRISSPPFAILQWMRLIELTAGPPGYRVIKEHLSLAHAPKVL